MTKVRLIASAIVLVAVGLALWWLIATVTGGKSAKVQAELNGNQAGAAVESGRDAVNTVGARAAAEGENRGKVTDAQANIHKASNGAAADRATLDGLCDVSPDYCRGDGLQPAHP